MSWETLLRFEAICLSFFLKIKLLKPGTSNGTGRPQSNKHQALGAHESIWRENHRASPRGVQNCVFRFHLGQRVTEDMHGHSKKATSRSGNPSCSVCRQRGFSFLSPPLFPLFPHAPKSPGLTQSIEGETNLRGSACDHVLRLVALSSNSLDTPGACL